jgi:hypothetical protein
VAGATSPDENTEGEKGLVDIMNVTHRTVLEKHDVLEEMTSLSGREAGNNVTAGLNVASEDLFEVVGAGAGLADLLDCPETAESDDDVCQVIDECSDGNAREQTRAVELTSEVDAVRTLVGIGADTYGHTTLFDETYHVGSVLVGSE